MQSDCMKASSNASSSDDCVANSTTNSTIRSAAGSRLYTSSTQATQAKNSSSKLSGEATRSRCSTAAAFLCAPNETCALLKTSATVVGAMEDV